MPEGTKVAKAETALKAEARKKGLHGKKADAYVFGTLNKIGLKKGSKSTPAGLAPAKSVLHSAYRGKTSQDDA